MDFADKYVHKPTIPEGPRLHVARSRPDLSSLNKSDPAPFRARSMPDFGKSAALHKPRPRRQRQGPHLRSKDDHTTIRKSGPLTPTVPQPFPLESLARHERAVAVLEQRNTELDEEERQRRVFRARPLSEDMLNGATFVPTIGTAPRTEPEDVVTASRNRANRRAEFDSRTAKRIAAEELHRVELEAVRLAQEQEDMRKHWKEHGFRARPVPSSTYTVPTTLRRSTGSDKSSLRPRMASNGGAVRLSVGSDKSVLRPSMESNKSWSATPEQIQESPKTPLGHDKVENAVVGKDSSSNSPFSPTELIANVKRVIQSYREHSPKVGSPS